MKKATPQKRQRNICIAAGLIAGALADGYLRLTSGDEGNLLVHTAVFLVSAAIAMFAAKALLRVRENRSDK